MSKNKLTLISDTTNRAEIVEKLSRFVDPAILREQRRREAQEKYSKLLDQLNFKQEYNKELLPFIHFYKLLARKTESKSIVNRLKMWVPDTIVLNDGDSPPMWLYSNQQGYVFRSDQFTSKNVISKLANYTSPDELVAVIKKPYFRNMELSGNDVKLVCCRDLPTIVNSQFSNKSELCVIQKFVKSNGPKAFICRTVWRKEKNPYAWIITNKDDFFKEDVKNEAGKYITNPRNQGSCTIVNTCRGKYVEESVPYIKNLLNYLHIHLKVRFKEFVADFIKDESGIWWFINVKGFTLEDENMPMNIKGITHDEEETGEEKGEKQNLDLCQKMKMCKYCEQYFPEVELQHKMTLKMVIQTDKHLYWRGKPFDWLTRSDITNLEVSNLYQEHKVCKQCYKLYKETEKLIELECHFNRFLGVPVTEDTQYQMLTLKANQTNNEPLKPTDGFEQEEECKYDIISDIFVQSRSSISVPPSSSYSPPTMSPKYSTPRLSR